MSDPNIQDLAGVAQASYQGEESPAGYTRNNELSTPDVSVFKHDTNPHHIVAHRGTDLQAKTAGRDIKHDFRLLFGNANHDSVQKKRTKQTEHAYRQIKEAHPTHDIHLVGHSLGGHTSHQTLAKNDFVRNNTASAHTFNAGSSPLQSKPLAKTNKNFQQVKDLSTHHRISGDMISEHNKSNLIGTHKTYKTNAKPSVGQHLLNVARPLLDKSGLGKLVHYGTKSLLGTLQSHSLSNFIKPNKSIK